jgi:septal ring factor EnvC (AmiA/AmiB activator)
MAVTLTRMEGKLDNVMEKVGDLRAEVTQHRGEIRALQSVTQQLESDMKSAEEARMSAATAVKDADAARVAQAKALVDNSTQKWTPFQRLLFAAGSVATVIGALYYVYLMTH